MQEVKIEMIEEIRSILEKFEEKQAKEIEEVVSKIMTRLDTAEQKFSNWLLARVNDLTDLLAIIFHKQSILEAIEKENVNINAKLEKLFDALDKFYNEKLEKHIRNIEEQCAKYMKLEKQIRNIELQYERLERKVRNNFAITSLRTASTQTSELSGQRTEFPSNESLNIITANSMMEQSATIIKASEANTEIHIDDTEVITELNTEFNTEMTTEIPVENGTKQQKVKRNKWCPLLCTSCATGICFADLIPQLAHQYPDSNVRLIFIPSRAPIVLFQEKQNRISNIINNNNNNNDNNNNNNNNSNSNNDSNNKFVDFCIMIITIIIIIINSSNNDNN
ncbi:LBP/BPI/CETP family domain-containing protein [Dirofilaria immitis]|nr:LBP/BPI/CETP family domain-containing protein [Dirofilaria immitis]